ncbi:hypothetical protein C9I86_16810 [Photobacterium sp. NCIMB 13483]|uniref:glycosyltransferase n=1 Tax=Photobacterium sp. NCIMB 13483 TaxID=2022103 RepID=UPI000D162BBC|nr:glycosyltransferase [Photobacterium sp. NCIMB 13483]PST85896.1 hypothetical protein C9I86_16810 [Photobacterium sp. NCIMB 13483]
MILGLYCNWGVIPADDGFYIEAIHAKYLYAFKSNKSIGRVVLLSNTKFSKVNDSHVFIPFSDVELIKLPSFNSYIKAMKNIGAIKNGIKDLCNKADYIYIRTPEPFSWMFNLYKNKSKLNYHFTSNPIEVIKSGFRNAKVKTIAKLFLFYPEYYIICLSARLNQCSANGDSVINDLPLFLKNKVNVLIESSLTKQEIDIKEKGKEKNYNDFSFLCVSRLQEGKGLENLILAFKNIVKLHSYAVLTIVGSGALYSKLNEMILFHKLENNIRMLGFIKNGPDLDQVYKDHNYFINPSLSETGPRVILEAMYHNLFCISTDVGYVRRVMTDKNNNLVGNISASKDSKGLYDSILFCLNSSSPEFIGSRATKGNENSIRFTLDKFVDEVINEA